MTDAVLLVVVVGTVVLGLVIDCIALVDLVQRLLFRDAKRPRLQR